VISGGFKVSPSNQSMGRVWEGGGGGGAALVKRRLEEEEELVAEEGDLGTSVGDEGPEKVRDLEGKSLARMGILI